MTQSGRAVFAVGYDAIIEDARHWPHPEPPWPAAQPPRAPLRALALDRLQDDVHDDLAVPNALGAPHGAVFATASTQSQVLVAGGQPLPTKRIVRRHLSGARCQQRCDPPIRRPAHRKEEGSIWLEAADKQEASGRRFIPCANRGISSACRTAPGAYPRRYLGARRRRLPQDPPEVNAANGLSRSRQPDRTWHTIVRLLTAFSTAIVNPLAVIQFSPSHRDVSAPNPFSRRRVAGLYQTAGRPMAGDRPVLRTTLLRVASGRLLRLNRGTAMP